MKGINGMKMLLSVLLVILVCDQVTNGYRILGVFPLNGKSHWVMMEELMKGLARRGHQVDVVTHFPLKKPIPNYTEINLDGTLLASINNLTAMDLAKFSDTSLSFLILMGGTLVCDLLHHPKLQDLIKNPPQDPPYDLVITEVFLAPCYLAFGRHLKVPLVGVVSSTMHDWLNYLSGNPGSPAYVPSLFSTFTVDMNFMERATNLFLTNWISLQVHYYTNAQVQQVKKAFGMELSCIKDLYKDVALYLVNSHHSLQGVRPTTPAVVNVGGLHVQDNNEPLPKEVQKWLDESKHGCVYFTFGSMMRFETFPREQVEQFYRSFEKIAPVRVLMKVAKKEDLLPGLPKNVMTQPWFSQISVLKHKNIRAFITHGGLMGTQEAIHYAVPLIGIPLFGDQRTNIQNYVGKKVAISLGSIEKVTEEKLTSALNSILNDPSYRENAQRLSKLFLDRPMSAMDTAIYWVEYVAKHGNILQSPAMRLNWWQRNLLDIWGVIVLALVVVLCITLFILRLVKKLLCAWCKCAKEDNTAIKSKKNK